MISFCGPCLKSKIVIAFKGHSGFNGFLPPYYNKYLTRTVKETVDYSGFTYPGGGQPYPGSSGITTYQTQWNVDRFTGQFINPPVNPPVRINAFPFFGRDVPAPMPPANGVTNYVVQEAYYSATHYFSSAPLLGLGKNTIEVTLSSPYPLAELDADTDALINTIDPATLAWGQGQMVVYNNPDLGLDPGLQNNGLLQPFLPPIAQYYPPGGPLMRTGITVAGAGGVNGQIYKLTVPFTALCQASIDAGTTDIGAAAGYVYAPSPFDEPLLLGYDRPGNYMKFIGWFGMAGNYCQKNFYQPWRSSDIASQTCQSGSGTCASGGFRVNAAPIIIGEDSYSLIVPNCQCGS